MPFNEAPASATIRCTLRGYDVMFTLRDETGIDLLKKVPVVLDALEKAGAQPVPAGRTNIATGSNGDATVTEDAPICAIHKTPMARRQGKNGSFWSCGKRLDDGSWCPYKPPRSA